VSYVFPLPADGGLQLSSSRAPTVPCTSSSLNPSSFGGVNFAAATKEASLASSRNHGRWQCDEQDLALLQEAGGVASRES
jgi:hypothetical protein